MFRRAKRDKRSGKRFAETLQAKRVYIRGCSYRWKLWYCSPILVLPYSPVVLNFGAVAALVVFIGGDAVEGFFLHKPVQLVIGIV